jgi:uncharacterized protein YyaL (SSP411 family)
MPMSHLPWPTRPVADGRLQLLLLLDPLDRWSAELERALAADAELLDFLTTGFSCARSDIDRERTLAREAQAVLAATAGEQGWPALLARLPDGQPVGGIAYRPARGRGGLATVAMNLWTAWQDAPADLEADAARLAQFLQGLAAPPARTLPPRELLAGRLEAEAVSARRRAGRCRRCWILS